MAGYSNEEKLDMLETYFKSNRNATEASRTYEENFPERTHPSKRYFRRLIVNLLNDGSFEKRRSSHYNINNQENINTVTEYVANNDTTSVRQAAREVEMSKTTVHRILRKQKFHPYKPVIVQGLNHTDYPRRMAFSEWYTHKCEEDPEFHKKVLWIDETRFTNCGIYNRHNTHFWSVENPHKVTERRFQTKFGFNVLCGIIGK